MALRLIGGRSSARLMVGRRAAPKPADSSIKASKTMFLMNNFMASGAYRHGVAPLAISLKGMQNSVKPDDEQERAQEQHHARKLVQKALAGGVAKVVGNQAQAHHPDDVGGE